MRKVYYDDRKEHILEKYIKEFKSDHNGYVDSGLIDSQFLFDAMTGYLKKNYHPLRSCVKEPLSHLDMTVDLNTESQRSLLVEAFMSFIMDENAFNAFVDCYKAYCPTHMLELTQDAWDAAWDEVEIEMVKDGFLAKDEKDNFKEVDYTIFELAYDEKYCDSETQAKIRFPGDFTSYVDTSKWLSDFIIEAPDNKEPILLIHLFNKSYPMGVTFACIKSDRLKEMLEKHPELKDIYEKTLKYIEESKKEYDEMYH